MKELAKRLLFWAAPIGMVVTAILGLGSIFQVLDLVIPNRPMAPAELLAITLDRLIVNSGVAWLFLLYRLGLELASHLPIGGTMEYQIGLALYRMFLFLSALLLFSASAALNRFLRRRRRS